MKRQNLKLLKLNKKAISTLNQVGGVPGKPPSNKLPHTLHCPPNPYETVTKWEFEMLCLSDLTACIICN